MLALSSVPRAVAPLVLALAPLAQAPEPEAAGSLGEAGFALEFPAGAAAERWAEVRADTEPAARPADWDGLLASGTWDREGSWRRWLELVGAEGSAVRPDPGRRATLALLAMEHGRSEDAWRHFAALAGHPEWIAAIAAPLWLGSDTRVGRGGAPLPVPDGARLGPRLPPGIAELAAGGLVWREAQIVGLVLGEARVALRIAVETDGVQLDMRHLSGPAANAAVVLPVPLGFERQVEYVDWVKQASLGAPHAVELVPGPKKLALWGRFVPSELALPAVRPPGSEPELPASLREGGLWLVDREDSADALSSALAEGLGELLDIEARCVAELPGAQPSPGGTVVNVPTGSRRAAYLALLASAVEAWVLPEEPGAGPR